MRTFDHDYVDEILARLATLEAESKPRWGTMNGAQVMGHLAMVVRYSMGRGPTMPDKSTWVSRNVIRPLLFAGWLSVPKNVKVPAPEGAERLPTPSADLETLQAVIEDYLAVAQTGDVAAPPHPLFGDIGADGWARFHCVHFDHHLKQFGV